MYSQSFSLAGYQPAWAPEQRGKRENELAVLDGENFFWNLRGVQSGFGALHPETAALPTMSRHPSIQWVRNQKFFFCDDGVYQVLPSGSFQLVFAFVMDVVHPTYDLGAYKWTYAYVGTAHWFCHPLVDGVIFYDEFLDTWSIHRDACWNGPNYAITHADNRLVVLLEDNVVWSKFDEGDKFDCGWQCGAGSQSLALIRYGQPYSVMPYNSGWITFTSKGVMVSSPDNSQVMDPDDRRIQAGLMVFRHDEATFDNLPLGPACIEHVDEKQVIWLSTIGFFVFQPTQGGGFGGIQPFEPEMGRFYGETLVPEMLDRETLIDSFCLHYARDLNWLFVSSRGVEPLVYDRAHVYQFALNRWGSFNKQHVCIGFGRHDDEISGQANKHRHFGYINADMQFVEVDPMQPASHSWVKFSPMRFQVPNEDTLAPTMSSVQGLRIGVARPAYDATMKGLLKSSWHTSEEAEHAASHFHVLIASSFDSGLRIEAMEMYAQLVRRDHDVAHYSCDTNGVNHTLIVTALDDGQHFDIRHIEMSFFWTGVM